MSKLYLVNLRIFHQPTRNCQSVLKRNSRLGRKYSKQWITVPTSKTKTVKYHKKVSANNSLFSIP